MVKIELESVEDTPIEDTTWYDYVALVLCVFLTSYLVVLTCVLNRYKSNYIPLKLKNVPNLTIINCAALVHVWAVFISNDHIESLRYLKKIDCALWSYILQYALGLNIWFIAILYRATSYSLIFNSKYLKHRRCFEHRNAIRLTLVFALCVPMFFICASVYAAKGITYSREVGTCVSTMFFKVAILAWVCAGLVIMAVFALGVHVSVDSPFFRENTILKHICWICICVILLGAAINFSGLINFSMGRCLFTVGVIILHAVSSTRLGLDIAVKSAKNDYKLLNNVIEDLDPVNKDDIGMKTFSIANDPQFLDTRDQHAIFNTDSECINFIGFCSKRTKFRDEDAAIFGITNNTSLTPQILAKLFLQIRRFKSEFYKNPIVAGTTSAVVVDDKALQITLQKNSIRSLLQYIESLNGFPSTVCLKTREMCDIALSYDNKLHNEVFNCTEKWIKMLFTTAFMKIYIKERQGTVVVKNIEKEQLLASFKQEGLLEQEFLQPPPQHPPYQITEEEPDFTKELQETLFNGVSNKKNTLSIKVSNSKQSDDDDEDEDDFI